jgi:hypothetical protein
MPVITAGVGTLDVSGLGAGRASVLEADASEPIQVTGLPASVDVVTETPSSTPDSVRARLLTSTGVFVRHLTRLDGLRWLDEHNSPGAGSIDMRRDLDQLAAGNQIVVSVGSRDVFRVVLDSEAGFRIDATRGRVDAWAGTGALGVLNSGMVIPEYGWRPEATEERSFDYGSDPTKGGWFVSREWRTPVGKLVRKSWRWTYKKRHQPKGWPEKKAQWLWWRNPDAKHTANETCHFGDGSFTLASAGRVKFWVAGDDTLEFQVDGEVRATTGPGGWRKVTKFVLNLSAGTHYIGAKVQNTAGSSGNQNRSGLVFAIARINGDGDVTKWLLRSSPSTIKVRRQLSAPPGWFAAQIIRQLVFEQAARGVAGHSPITYGFTTAKDSHGVAWSTRQEVAIPVGTNGLDWMQQMVEAGLDVAMSPSLRLDVWRKRGSDRSRTVRIDQGDQKPTDESGNQEAPIRNVAYGRAKSGWVGVSSASSIAARGRRETLVSLGGSRSSQQTLTTLLQMLPDMANPPQTWQVSLSGASGGKQPYRDFAVGDWISYRPPGRTTWARCRVMSIEGVVNPAGYPDWTLQLYEDA